MVSHMLPKTMSELAHLVGCERYPARWDDLYDALLSELQQSGNPYIDPEYYAKLHQHYGILPNYLSLYQEAAIAIGKDPLLSTLLYILCRTLQDRQYHSADMASFTRPIQEDNFACNMLCALAAASEAPMCYALLSQLNLPDEIISQIMRMPEFGITFYKLRHNGAPGYSILDWYQLAIDGKLFRIGRLEFEIFATFQGRACVFENKDGDQIALAHSIDIHASGVALGSVGYEDPTGSFTANIIESEEAWRGYPVRQDGTVAHQLITLPKKLWQKRLAFGDPVVSIHIPAGGGLTEEAVSQSLGEAKQFLAQYFPDFSYKGFVCYSWLMDYQLVKLLGPDCNISKLNLRFRKLPRKSKGHDVLSFVFLQPTKNPDLTTLPERTTLERKLKQHYLSGKYIYELTGYFF